VISGARGAGQLAAGAAGGALLVVCVTDITFLASRVHRALWMFARAVAAPLPDRSRHALLSLASAALPAALLLWLGLSP
jgi:hypothetical protein